MAAVAEQRLDSGAVYFAHAGHWLTGIAYFVPVIAFLIWLGVTQIRERRRGSGS
jgi:hypothetical protein